MRNGLRLVLFSGLLGCVIGYWLNERKHQRAAHARREAFVNDPEYQAIQKDFADNPVPNAWIYRAEDEALGYDQ
jgi:hypothetical protein